MASAAESGLIDAIDAHQHFWSRSPGHYTWIGPELGVLDADYAPEDLEPQLADAGVRATIVVQADNTRSDTAAMLDAARQWPWIDAVVGWLPLGDPAAAERELAQLAADPVVRGIRHIVHQELDEAWLLRGPVLRSLGLVAEAGLLFEIPCEFPRHLRHVPQLADAVPGLRIVIDHLGMPPGGERWREERWARELRAAAAVPDVCAKLSGLGRPAGADPHPEAAIARWTEVALDAFGPERLMAGSDWPVSLLSDGYARTWRRLRGALVPHGEIVARQVLADTAARVYCVTSVAAEEPVR
jgi:L-fuconolactonase